MKRDVLQLSVIVVWKQEAIAQSKELVRLAADTAATTEPDRSEKRGALRFSVICHQGDRR